MIEAFLLKLRARDVVSDEEQKAIESLFSEVREVPSDKTLIRAGDRLNISLLLLDGVLCRYKDLRDGSRQMIESAITAKSPYGLFLGASIGMTVVSPELITCL